MRVLRVVLIGLIVSVFLVGQAYSAPKENNGKSDQANNGNANNDNANNGNANNGNANNGNANNGNANNGNANNGRAQAAQSNQANNKGVSQTKGEAAVHKQQARRSSEINRKREERNHSSDRNSSLNNGKSELAFNDHAPKANNARRSGDEMRKDKADHGFQLLDALNRARWAYNPHDTRGQGNMGKVDMQDPFGHDKDSDRKELYGNNGRPIRGDEEAEPVNNEEPQVAGELPIDEPVIVEELPVEELPGIEEETALLDLSIDFTSIEEMQWLVDWYNSILASYNTNSYYQSIYTYEQWQSMWYNHFFPGGDLSTATGIRLNNTWDSTERYDYDILLNGYEGDTLLVTTTMTLAQDYSGWDYYYDENNVLRWESVEFQSGEVVYSQTSEMSVDSTTDSITVGIAATDDLIAYASGGEVYIDMAVTITDPSTGATYTQTYDQSLYLYRCPYGKITDKQTGQAIVGAKITVHYEDGSIVALDKASNKTASNPQMTDATGRFGFILQSNKKYYMVASAEGYEDYQSDIFTEQWHILREDIALAPKPEQMVSNVK